MTLLMGCDPHLDSFTVSVIDALGGEVTAATLANHTSGWSEAVGLCRRLQVPTVGIEGASGYGRRLAQTLVAAGICVVETPTRLTARIRHLDGAGKTDPGDARAVARAVANGQGSRWVNDTSLETVRVLSHRRDTLVKNQTAELNQLRALLIEIDPHRAASTPRIRSTKTVTELSKVRYGGDQHRLAVSRLIRELARDCLRRRTQIKQLANDIQQVMSPAGTALQDIPGVGVITAAAILAEVAGTNGFATNAKMAAWAGTAPLDASSGRQQRHRLNRGGNRQVNRAIHVVATTQIRLGGPGADYMKRRIQEGKTRREAIRALKRHLTRVIWKTLREHDLT